jgi:hypothetical protein
MNYVRLIVGTVNAIVAATNVYILKGLVSGGRTGAAPPLNILSLRDLHAAYWRA